MEIVTVDLGGTHARFAIANITDRHVNSLDAIVTLPTAHYRTFKMAWDHYEKTVGRPLPQAAAIAVACPVNDQVMKLTNNSWTISVDELRSSLALNEIILVNDFGAVGHAVSHIGNEHFYHITGPACPLSSEGLISIVGPGTGLGVAQLLRRNGHDHVIETEGGHSDFAPLDAIEEALMIELRNRYQRVSVERVVSGPSLHVIYETLAKIENKPVITRDDQKLWSTAIAGNDPLATSALEHFCRALGSVAGNVALTQGAKAVVIAGGVGARLVDILPKSGFASRFTAKGRFKPLMDTIPVKLMTHPHVGLIGAASAFTKEYL